MKKITIFLLTILSFGKLSAQCGVNFLYDAAGNRTQRIECVSLLANPNNITQTTEKAANDRESIEKEAAFGELSLFPNPSTGIFQLSETDFDPKSIVLLLDSKGRTIFTKLLADGLFDISDKPAGIYFLKVQNAGNIRIARFIKE
jgi:Secretion system C-terminal sorting domain